MAEQKGLVNDRYWLEHNSNVYYTAEHSLRELESLRDRMMLGLARNQGGPASYVKYFLRKLYYRLPVLQKLRRWRGPSGFCRSRL